MRFLLLTFIALGISSVVLSMKLPKLPADLWYVISTFLKGDEIYLNTLIRRYNLPDECYDKIVKSFVKKLSFYPTNKDINSFINAHFYTTASSVFNKEEFQNKMRAAFKRYIAAHPYNHYKTVIERSDLKRFLINLKKDLQEEHTLANLQPESAIDSISLPNIRTILSTCSTSDLVMLRTCIDKHKILMDRCNRFLTEPVFPSVEEKIRFINELKLYTRRIVDTVYHWPFKLTQHQQLLVLGGALSCIQLCFGQEPTALKDLLFSLAESSTVSKPILLSSGGTSNVLIRELPVKKPFLPLNKTFKSLKTPNITFEGKGNKVLLFLACNAIVIYIVLAWVLPKIFLKLDNTYSVKKSNLLKIKHILEKEKSWLESIQQVIEQELQKPERLA